MVNKIVSFVACLWLVACTTPLSKKECQDGDWNHRGFEDATHGVDLADFDKRVQSCEKMGYKVDRELYERGYSKGLESFCTYQRGFKQGLDNQPKKENCPPEFAKDYDHGYQKGAMQRQFEKEDEADAKLRRQKEQQSLDENLREDIED